MRVVAICGPIGAPLERFVQDLIPKLDKTKTVACIYEQGYEQDPISLDHDALVNAIKSIDADVVIVIGHLLFSDEVLLNTLDISVFLEYSDDACLIQQLQDKKGSTTLEDAIQQYMGVVKPKNTLVINPSKKNATLLIPESASLSETGYRFTGIHNLLRSTVEMMPFFRRSDAEKVTTSAPETRRSQEI